MILLGDIYMQGLYMKAYSLLHVTCPRKYCLGEQVNLKGLSTVIRLECSFLPQPAFSKCTGKGRESSSTYK